MHSFVKAFVSKISLPYCRCVFHFNKFWHALLLSRHDLVFSYDKFITNFLWHQASFFSLSIFICMSVRCVGSKSSRRHSKMRWLIITKKIWAAEVICFKNISLIFLFFSLLLLNSYRRSWWASSQIWAVFIIIYCFLLFLIIVRYSLFFYFNFMNNYTPMKLMNFCYLAMYLFSIQNEYKMNPHRDMREIEFYFYCLFDILHIFPSLSFSSFFFFKRSVCQAIIIRESSWA